MYTDEYTISLSRELAVCGSQIRKVKQALAGLEHRYGYTTKDFSARLRSGQLTTDTDDFRRWSGLVVSLRAWTEKKEEYAALLLKMKG